MKTVPFFGELGDGFFTKFAANGLLAPFGWAVRRRALEIAAKGIFGDLSPIDLSRCDSLDKSPVVADRALVVQVKASVVR